MASLSSSQPSPAAAAAAAHPLVLLANQWHRMINIVVNHEISSPDIKHRHYCLIIAFTALLYINTLNGDFTYDDSRAIRTNQDLLSSTPWYSLFLNDFWGTPLKSTNTHGSYRPITVVSFRLNNLLHGLRPYGFHLFNVGLHSTATYLFMRFSAQIFNRRKRITLIAAALFASHPIHVESIASIVGRADVGAAIFYILAIMCYMKYCRLSDRRDRPQRLYLYTTLALATVSMLTKEHGITALAVCSVYHLFIHYKLFPLTPDIIHMIIIERRYKYLRIGLIHLWMSALLLIGLRIGLMGRTPVFAPSDNPASDHPSVIIRFLTFLYLPVFNFWLLIYPRYLSFDWSMESIPLVQSVGDPRNLVSIVFYTGLTLIVKCLLQYYYTKCQQMRSLMMMMATNTSTTTTSAPELCTFNGGCGCAPCCYQHHQHQHQHYKQQHQHLKRPFNYNNKSCNNNNNSMYSCDSYYYLNNNNNNNFNNNNNYNDTSSSTGSFYSTMTSSSSSSSMTMTQMDCITIGLSLLIIPFIPATNLFFYVGFVIAERILYIPSFGYCLLVAIGIDYFLRHRKTIRFVALVALTVLLVSFSWRTFIRNIDWLSEENLYRSGIDVNPPKAYGNLANILSSQSKKREAEQAYKKALTYRFNMADVHYNLGILLQEQGRYEEALQSYKYAVQFRPRLAMAHLNMGLVLVQLGRKQEAVDTYKHCSQLDSSGLKDPKLHDSTRISALFNLGRIYADDGDYGRALGIYLQAIDRMPHHYQAQSLYNMVGEAYFKLGQLADAEQWFKRSLAAKWDHIPAHLTYAKMLVKAGRTQESEQWFLKAKQLAPNDSSVYQHYGQFLSEQQRHEEAVDLYLKAIKLSPNDYEIVFNTANTLRQVKRNDEAENYYRWATRLRPNEATSHMNLGAMLHVNGKLREAELSYLEALRLKPDDQITQNNLSKLRHLMQQKRQQSATVVGDSKS
ncbi:protein O-mannosyl-transferase TMTC2-like [Oppia nitens]|uniref:protein O-mannosyl-transferase TMTC2-like n=1 Tax=Oppia nitens TaxID=1686743 RepID=UPI0023DB1703|nr:protein O-mannosyl-transferase TMTC2-like [Oppia nitens]